MISFVLSWVRITFVEKNLIANVTTASAPSARKTSRHSLCPCLSWLLTAAMTFLCALSAMAQRGATYANPIPIVFDDDRFAMVSDTCDTRLWGGDASAGQGMDIYYTLRLSRPANMVIHNLGSQVAGTSIDFYSMIVSCPDRAVTRSQYVDWMRSAGLWEERYAGQDIMSAVHLEAGLYRVTVCGRRVSSSGLTNGPIATTFICYTDSDFSAPFVPPFAIDGMERRPIDIGAKAADFEYYDARPYPLFPRGPRGKGHGCHYRLSLDKRFVIRSLPAPATTTVFVRDADGHTVATLPGAADSVTLRKGRYTIATEGTAPDRPLFLALTGRMIPAESDPEATPDEMVTAPSLDGTLPGAVGSIQGAYATSATGAATYTMSIETPRGVGGVRPGVALVYNSQSGMGLGGLGTTLTGLSAITRTSTDMTRDGVARGITLTETDALCLDGRRLLLVSGTAGADGSVYAPEGDPYVSVRLHGTGTGQWMEYRGHGGMSYVYGRTAAARQTVTGADGQPRVYAWYLSRCEDVHGNYATYDYLHDSLMVYPRRITYGDNSHQPTGLSNTIEFGYNDTGVMPRRFHLGRSAGLQRWVLSSIQTGSDGHTLRSYSMAYDTRGAFPRLTAVTVANADGDILRPTTMAWGAPAQSARTVQQIDIPLNNGYKETYSNIFCAVDLTGDGIADIVRIADQAGYNLANGEEAWDQKTNLYVYPAYKEGNSIKHKTPLTYPLSANFEVLNARRMLGGTFPIDFNGDGYNDIVIPQTNTNNFFRQMLLYVVSGKEVNEGRIKGSIYGYNMISSSAELPCMTATDIDTDGRDEIIQIERETVNGHYPMSVMSCLSENIDENIQIKTDTTWVTLGGKPTRLFVADYNNDALPDIMAKYDSGYKIFLNNGTPGKARYDDASSVTGTDIPKALVMEQGDFDGDGLADFIYNTGGGRYYFALNRGNGTFEHRQAAELDLYDQKTHSDDDRYTCLVTDLDHDGLSDAVIAKAMYPSLDLIDSGKKQHTGISWLHNTGEGLEEVHRTTTYREDDALPTSFTIGDFLGNGDAEILAYGNNLYAGTVTEDSVAVRVYGTRGLTCATDRVTGITDGYGNSVHIDYTTLADGDTYAPGKGGVFPVNDVTVPLSVVRHTSATNGVAAPVNKTYRYGGLKIHRQGLGVLGYAMTQTTDSLTGTVATKVVTEWDTMRCTPRVIRETLVQGTDTAVTVTTQAFIERGGNYLAYTSQRAVTDMDGDNTLTTYAYDTERGCPLMERTAYGDGTMYRQTEYSGHVEVAGEWLPTRITQTQRHSDDTAPYTDTRSLAYDDRGDILTETLHDGQPLAVTTHRTYDVYGNTLSERSEGSGMGDLTTHSEYDATGRFVTRSHTVPSSAVTVNAYDRWGHLTRQTDATTGEDGPATTYTYDAWGNRLTTTSPNGVTTTYTRGWTTEQGAAYYALEQSEGAPWTKTVCDATGRTLRTETVGERGMRKTTTLSYNARGECTERTAKSGRMEQTETSEYDARGRVTSVSVSTGRQTSYDYGRRTVTVTTGGRSHTKTVDAWGNTVSSTDPVSTVVYRYASCGKAVATTAAGSTVTSVYDGVGNQIRLSDPDAGTIVYEYDAAGRIVKQTDARGKVTRNTYDAIGRLTAKDIDGNVTTYTYGTEGNASQRLVTEQTADKRIDYAYDRTGRTIRETRTMVEATLVTATAYNELGQVASRTVSYTPANSLATPVQVTTTYSYDPYGHLLETHVGDSCVWRLSSVDGMEARADLGPSLRHITRHDDKGYLSRLTLSDADGTLRDMEFDYDGATGNLLARTGMTDGEERFGYDDLDRLVTVTTADNKQSRTYYADNGNITERTGQGGYHYDSDRPHAVTGVDNEDGAIATANQETRYNAFGKIEHINDCGTGYSMDLAYGPDRERWVSRLYRDSVLRRRTLYMGAVEVNEEYDGEGMLTGHTLYYYIGNGVIWTQRQDDGAGGQTLYAYTDNLGSVLVLYDSGGNRRFAATYDAWGRQSVTHDEIGFRRGYTGHEMLPEFDLVNMNGRLYDPVLGVFLSPDNYVQDPDNSQNYNRYSYCLNNPLKYTDPSGELFGIDDAIVAFAAFNIANSMMRAAFTGQSVWKAGAFSLLSSAASYGIGAAFGGMGNFGHELLRAGAHGMAGGVVAALNGGNFISSFVSGAMASGIGSYAQSINMNSGLMIASTTAMGGLAAWATGSDFIQGAMQGMMIGAFNHAMHDNIRNYKHHFSDKQLERIHNAYEEIKEKSAKQVYEIIGGPLGEWAKSQHFDYSCAARISYALNYGGMPIPERTPNTYQGKDGKWYFINAKAMSKYFILKWGNGLKVSPKSAKNGILFQYNFPNHSVSGHVEIVYRKQTHGRVYLYQDTLLWH